MSIERRFIWLFAVGSPPRYVIYTTRTTLALHVSLSNAAGSRDQTNSESVTSHFVLDLGPWAKKANQFFNRQIC
jgi:hypothetical protein